MKPGGAGGGRSARYANCARTGTTDRGGSGEFGLDVDGKGAVTSSPESGSLVNPHREYAGNESRISNPTKR